MCKINHTLLLFAIILIEGYVVLSTEVLAIRLTIPFIGSGTDTVSILIAAVLMPLALGYYAGGNFRPQRVLGVFFTFRKKLIMNIVAATLILSIGMSYRFLFAFFPFLNDIGIVNRLVQTAIYSSLFLVVPVFLLGQTVPLVTNFFPKERIQDISGKMLFISTIGSFLGATFTTIVLMSSVGVHHTITLNFLLLTVLVILISKPDRTRAIKIMLAVFALNIILNSNLMLRQLHVVKNNRYAAIAVSQNNGYNHLHINHNYDSKYHPQTQRKHNYIEFAEHIAINPIKDNSDPPREILVVGAGGFTFGHNDRKNHYTYVDIDGDLLRIAEKFILKEPIGENKKFIPEEVRAFLRNDKNKYDLIYLDAYLGSVSIPEHLVTQEFFLQVRNALNDNGVVIMNLIVSPNFHNTFTKSLDNTIRSVFPHVSRVAISDTYDPWNESDSLIGNVAYIYKHHPDAQEKSISTDTETEGKTDK